ncbi:MAG: gliding motility-associated C-terminal domain-containing protein [Bacteroidia bacterium]|nr:gliding motility-associated C-terminal domain-containing protein [Bacteroidia bacterium]MDW8346483.1 gliding motility-associated C-terminal domain-containing protein [Bacteroidia bacterium]
MKLRKFYILLAAILIHCNNAWSTHNRAGEITYIHVSGLTYQITITTFAAFGGSQPDRNELDLEIYSLNTVTNTWSLITTITVNRTSKVDVSRNGQNTYRNKYVTNYTFPSQGTFKLGMRDPNRNDGVLNIPNSVNVEFYIETQLQINFQFGINNSPVLLLEPLDVAALNRLFVHNPAAYDPDDDSLAFSLIPCQDRINSPIAGYVLPNNTPSCSGGTFTINNQNGEIRWNVPLCTGEFNIAILIEEYRRIPPRNNRIRIAYTIRDMQILVIPSNNNPPVILPIQDTCVVAGATVRKRVFATDSDVSQIVKMTAVSEVFSLPSSPATFTASIDSNPARGTFNWNTNCSHVRSIPYQVVFRAEDDAISVVNKPIPSLVDLRTYTIRVIAPPVTNLQVVSQFGKNLLSWDIHPCTNAAGYRVYRRQGCDTWSPGHCEIGVPAYTGYTLVATIPGRTNLTYTDDNGGAGFNFGSTYAYHVVAYFEETVPGTSTSFIASESIASNKKCITVKRDIPVITNASVLVTDSITGQVLVRWRRPDTANAKLPPGAIHYKIYQGTGLTTTAYTLIGTNTGGIQDTSFVVTNLDTKGITYSYRVEYVIFNSPQPEVKVATSTPASTPRLSATPLHRAAALSWNFNTPWTEDTFYVYRSSTLTGPYTLIATTTVPNYTDTGLQPRRPYFYYVTTSGAYYFTTEIKRPLLNNSQILKVIPKDTVPPCPTTLLGSIDCETQIYSFNWTLPNNTPCGEGDDNEKFNFYFKRYINSPYQKIATFTRSQLNTQTTFADFGLTGCYYVTVIDSSGNESPASNEVCFDNPCMELEFPNIITPSSGDEKNEVFKPKRYRFVDGVDMRIYNRWGVEVQRSSDITNFWNGTINGIQHPEGIYYFIATATIQRLQGVEKRKIAGNLTILR